MWIKILKIKITLQITYRQSYIVFKEEHVIMFYFNIFGFITVKNLLILSKYSSDNKIFTWYVVFLSYNVNKMCKIIYETMFIKISFTYKIPQLIQFSKHSGSDLCSNMLLFQMISCKKIISAIIFQIFHLFTFDKCIYDLYIKFWYFEFFEKYFFLFVKIWSF